ncbi:MAG: helix-turn-helix domain-containing protein [Gemmataceae bacterium]|nr:helix-turn-helix domain-containing protein [Gemmataceae bacterium]
MPRVFRQLYTRPIPADAERVTIRNKKGETVPAVRFRGSDGKTITAPVTTKGKNAGKSCRVVSPTWYGWVNSAAVPLCTNKTAAEIMLADLVRKAENAEVGIRDPFEQHQKRPLTEHLADYRRELEARGNAPRYISLVSSRLADLLSGCGFVFIPDLSASRVSDWLASLHDRPGRPAAELPPDQHLFTRAEVARLLGIKPDSVPPLVRRHRLAAEGQGKKRRFPRDTVEALQALQSQGVSVETTNQYLTHLKSFCAWLVKDRRTGENPIAHLEPGNAGVDRRHDRRELTAEELRRVLTAARDSASTFRGLDGRDRFHLYAVACGTGFRAGALASLTPESFDLDAETPVVTLAARWNKSRKTKEQPLPPTWRTCCATTSRTSRLGNPSGVGRGRGCAWPQTCCGSTWTRPASPTPSRGRTALCTPTFTRCGIRT